MDCADEINDFIEDYSEPEEEHRGLILILILAGLLTACVPTAGVTPDPDHGEEHLESSLNSAPFSENNTESESYVEADTQSSTECEISITEATVTTVKSQSETVCTITAVTDMQKEKPFRSKYKGLP